MTYLSNCARVGDLSPEGDLIEPGRYKVYGWASVDDLDAPVEDFYAATPAEAGEIMAQLLRDGYYQIGVFDARSPNRPDEF